MLCAENIVAHGASSLPPTDMIFFVIASGNFGVNPRRARADQLMNPDVMLPNQEIALPWTSHFHNYQAAILFQPTLPNLRFNPEVSKMPIKLLLSAVRSA